MAEEPKHGFPFTAIALTLLAVFALYMGAYYALVYPVFYSSFLPTRQTPSAGYTHGGRLAESIFAPANMIDRFLRPATWEAKEI